MDTRWSAQKRSEPHRRTGAARKVMVAVTASTSTPTTAGSGSAAQPIYLDYNATTPIDPVTYPRRSRELARNTGEASGLLRWVP
jgi:hypothetical protein